VSSEVLIRRGVEITVFVVLNPCNCKMYINVQGKPLPPYLMEDGGIMSLRNLRNSTNYKASHKAEPLSWP
jgi:hypothetical protein